MQYFSGLDVSVKETAICVVNGDGEVLLRVTVATEPAAIRDALRPFMRGLHRVGHEDLNALLDDAAQSFAKAVLGEEGAEGTLAFVQKRLPRWAQ